MFTLVWPPKKPKAAAWDPPSLTTPNSITWVCGAAKFTLKQVQRRGGGGGVVVVTIFAIELLNTDSEFMSFFSRWSASRVTSKM